FCEATPLWLLAQALLATFWLDWRRPKPSRRFIRQEAPGPNPKTTSAPEHGPSPTDRSRSSDSGRLAAGHCLGVNSRRLGKRSRLGRRVERWQSSGHGGVACRLPDMGHRSFDLRAPRRVLSLPWG